MWFGSFLVSELATVLSSDLQPQVKNKRLRLAGASHSSRKAIRSWALDVDSRVRVLDENSLFIIWDKAEPLAAGAVRANGESWENKSANGKAHPDGNVKAAHSDDKPTIVPT